MSTTTFIGTLSSLVAAGDFKNLHQKLSNLFDRCYLNDCEENAAACVDLIENHALVQGNLFRLLHLCVTEGGIYGGVDALKKRLVPWLCSSFVTSKSEVEDVDLLKEKYERTIRRLEDELKQSQSEAAELRIKFDDVRREMKGFQRQLEDGSSEMNDLTNKLQNASAEAEENERELKVLKREIARYKEENDELHDRLRKQFAYPSSTRSPSRTPVKVEIPEKLSPRSPSSPSKPIYTGLSSDGVLPYHNRPAKLVEQFAEIYNKERIELMENLLGLADTDTNERLIFALVEESFIACKLAQRKMRTRMRQALQPSESSILDQDRVEEIVENYMKKNTENYDVDTIIPDVLRAVRRNTTLAFSIPSNEKILIPLVRECVRTAWSMVALYPAIDMASALEGDIMNEERYRRAYTSEFSSQTVHHFIWPCLIRDGQTVVKGEVVTRRPLNALSDKLRKSPSSPSLRSRSAEPSLSLNESFDQGIGSMSSSWSESAYRRITTPINGKA